MANSAPPRAPQSGDPFLLNGFLYRLAGTKKELDRDERVLVLRDFVRDGLTDLQEAQARFKAARSAAKAAAAADDIDESERQNVIATAVAEEVADIEAHQEPFRRNFNYKKDGKCLDSELVWCEPHDLLAEMRTQSATLARGNPRLKAWAEGCAIAQADALEGQPACWTLSERHLVKPPVVVRDGREMVLVPQDAKHAAEVCAAVLNHSFYATEG